MRKRRLVVAMALGSAALLVTWRCTSLPFPLAQVESITVYENGDTALVVLDPEAVRGLLKDVHFLPSLPCKCSFRRHLDVVLVNSDVVRILVGKELIVINRHTYRCSSKLYDRISALLTTRSSGSSGAGLTAAYRCPSDAPRRLEWQATPRPVSG